MITRYVTANLDPAIAHEFTISAHSRDMVIELAQCCPHETTSITISPIAPTEQFPDTLGVDQPSHLPPMAGPTPAPKKDPPA